MRQAQHCVILCGNKLKSWTRTKACLSESCSNKHDSIASFTFGSHYTPVPVKKNPHIPQPAVSQDPWDQAAERFQSRETEEKYLTGRGKRQHSWKQQRTNRGGRKKHCCRRGIKEQKEGEFSRFNLFKNFLPLLKPPESPLWWWWWWWWKHSVLNRRDTLLPFCPLASLPFPFQPSSHPSSRSSSWVLLRLSEQPSGPRLQTRRWREIPLRWPWWWSPQWFCGPLPLWQRGDQV